MANNSEPAGLPGKLPSEQRVNILLVDDQPGNLLALEAILGDLGQNLVRAHSGEEALSLLLKQDFAVVLLDVQMHGLDGFETAKLIRQRKSRRTPIIFITAYEDHRFPVEQAYLLGAVDYLVKPLVPVILRAKVAGFVELFEKTEEVKRQAEHLRLLIEGSKDYAMFLLDPRGYVVSWNAGAEHIKAYRAEEIVGQHFSRFYPAEAVASGQPERGLRTAAARGKHEEEGWRVRKDGSQFWASVVITALRDDAGNLRGFSKVTRDITEHKQAEENAQRLLHEEAARRAAEAYAEVIQGQREQLRVTLQSIGDGVIATDAAGRVMLLNPVAEALTGWTNREAAGQPLQRVFHIVSAVTRQEVENPAAKALATGHVVGLADDTLLVARDGTERPIDDSAAPIKDEQGRTTGVVLVFQDVTERQRAERELRESEQRFARFMHHLPGLAWIKDLQGRYIYANDAALKAFGTPREALYGTTDRDVFPPETAAQFQANDRRALASGAGEQMIEELRREDGVLHHSVVNKFPMPGPTGEPALVGGMAIDITDLKRADERLRFLAEASKALTSSLDYEATLKSVAELAVPALADWCAVDVLLEDQSMRRVAVVHPEPAKVALGYELLRRYPLRVDMPEGTVLRTGRSVLHPELTEAHLSAYARDQGHLAVLRGLGLKSTMVVPLSARGRILGAISLVTGESGRRYDSADLALAEELARRAAVAIDNARLFRSAQAALHQKEETLALLDTLQSNAPVGFAFVDRDFRYVRINAALAAINGRSPAEHLGRTVAESVPLLWPQLEPLYRRVLDNNEAITDQEITGETAAAPGQVRHWTVSYYPVQFHSEIAGVGILVSDITERKRLEEELRRQASELQEADRQKNEFLAILAHELRNPLAPIRNALHLLQMPGVGADAVRQAKGMMERQVHHLVRLVDDLLDVSRILRGKIELRKERVELAAVVERAVETAQPVIDAQGHSLTISLPPEPLWLEADPVRLAQVVSNLLNNAAKYTERGGRISLHARGEGAEVVVRVEDTGIGIEPEMLPRIFGPFFQVDRSADRSQGGMGVGLALVRKLVEMHGGRAQVSSGGLGRGSEFTVRLPAPVKTRGSDHQGAEAEKPFPAPASPRLRILVVDDHADAAESLAMILRLDGHDVRVAHDGPEALGVAQSHLPHLAFLDIGMPGMDGYELCRRMRAQPALREVLLVALTGWGQEEDRRRSREAGFDRHLVKPVEPGSLRRLLTHPKFTGR
jgi:PAS domain S-box-containing protein